MRVAPRGSDELDDLGRAFDRMVAELAEARSRLVYLAEGVGLAGGGAPAGPRDQEPAHADPAGGAGAGLQVPRRGSDLSKLLDTAQEILNEEVGVIRRLVDDFSAFAKLPKVEPVPVDLGQVVDDFARAHPEWQKALR